MLGHNNGTRDSPMTTVKKAAESVAHQGHKAANSATETVRHVEKKAENALHGGGNKTHGATGGHAHGAKRTVENKSEEVSHRVEEAFNAGGRKAEDMAHHTPAHHSTPAHQSHGVKNPAVKIKEKVLGHH